MAEGFCFVEGAAKRGFLEGAAKPCFSLICRKLLGKFHFQGFLFAASSRGSCNFGGLLLQQAPRKLSGKSHLQVLLLQAIGEIQFWGFSFPPSSWELCTCKSSDAASAWETLGKIPCKLSGTSHFNLRVGFYFGPFVFGPHVLLFTQDAGCMKRLCGGLLAFAVS